MSTPAALYYPHTNITDKNIIKNSLLLWDNIEYITPFQNWNHSRFDSKPFNEAIEIISKPHFPTENERKEVHDRVSTLLKKDLPQWFFLDEDKTTQDYKTYAIYPNKLFHKTWQLLTDHNMARFNEMDSDFHLSTYFGLMLMSLLADACAGETKRKITDQAEAYSWIQKCTIVEAGGEYITGLDISKVAPTYERLVTLSIKVLNTDDIPISALVAMRKREAKSSTNDYRNFRIGYLDRIDDYVSKITKNEFRQSDVIEIERQFQKDMESDLQDLRSELKLAKSKLLFSKEIAVAAGATAKSLETPINGLTDLTTFLAAIGVGALVKAGKEYKTARTKALKSNSMSWLYLTDKRANRFNPKNIIL